MDLDALCTGSLSGGTDDEGEGGLLSASLYRGGGAGGSGAGASASASTVPTNYDRSDPLTLADVETYVKFKAFDVIGNGSYRKYVNSCRERGEDWAQKMMESVGQVLSATKRVQHLVSDLQSAGKNGLYLLCQTVIENNTPPIDQNTVISECSVSGKAKCQCIVLKCKGRGAPFIMVQNRFGHFVLMLWTVFKMDLVIKTVTRDFIDSMEQEAPAAAAGSGGDTEGAGDERTMGELCESFMSNGEQVTKLANAVLHALQHVRLSLQHALTS